VTTLEDLQRQLSDARRTWKWDDVRRLEAAITAEKARLVQVAATLPEPEETPARKAKPKKTPKKSKSTKG
jgi:hypothetical protein